MTASQTVLIVAARCPGGCPERTWIDLEDGTGYHDLPYPVSRSKAEEPFRCAKCGGQVLLSQALPGEVGP